MRFRIKARERGQGRGSKLITIDRGEVLILDRGKGFNLIQNGPVAELDRHNASGFEFFARGFVLRDCPHAG